MELRKIIQITMIFNPEGDELLHALCNDGTVWYKLKGDDWEQVDTIKVTTW